MTNKQKSVFTVLRQEFYTSEGTEYASAINPLDCKVFKKFEDAARHVALHCGMDYSKIIEECDAWSNDEGERYYTYRKDYAEADTALVWIIIERAVR